MRAFRASSSSLSPSWKSMARLVLPSRLELKRPEGSFREAPLAKVILTTFLYVSPVQISPLCDHTGVPLHFHSSATSGSASLIRARSRESISPLQSPSSSILASISSEGDSAARGELGVFTFATAGFLADTFVDLDAVAPGTTERAGWTLELGIRSSRSTRDSR